MQVFNLRVRQACADKGVEEERDAAANQAHNYLDKLENLKDKLLNNSTSSACTTDLRNEAQKLANEMSSCRP